MTKTKISIILFIFSILFYIVGLFGNFSPLIFNILFWIPSILIIGIIVYQIIYIEKCNPLIILIEIIIFSISLHFIYQVGYFGLRGSDSYFGYNLIKLIISNGFFNITQQDNSWPLTQILFSEISLTSHINPLTLSKYLPSFLSSASLVILFLLIRKIYGDNKIEVALFSCLMFSTVPNFINFDALFVNEILGIFFILLTFFVIYLYIKKDKIFIYLILILIPAIILTHHFSSFLLAVLLSFYILLEKIIPKLKKVPLFNFKNIKYTKFNIDNLLIFIIVSLITYWVYVGILVLNSIGTFVNGITGVTEVISYSQQIGLSSPIVTLRGDIIFYGFFLFMLVFLILLIIENIKNNDNKPEEYLFTLFFIFCAGLGFVTLFLAGGLITPDRMIEYAYLFGIIPVVALFFGIKKFTKVKKTFFVLLILFMLFNLYNVDPTYINHDLASNGLPELEEYSIANTIQFPDSFRNNQNYDLYYGYEGVNDAIFDVQGINPRIHAADAIGVTNISSYIVIIDEATYIQNLNILEKKDPQEYNKLIKLLNYKNDNNVDKIADIDNGKYILWGIN